VPYVTHVWLDAQGVIVAATDYLKTLPNMVSKWVPAAGLATLGTDGLGRSGRARVRCRDFFEVDAKFITLATLHELALDGRLKRRLWRRRLRGWGLIRRNGIR